MEVLAVEKEESAMCTTRTLLNVYASQAGKETSVMYKVNLSDPTLLDDACIRVH